MKLSKIFPHLRPGPECKSTPDSRLGFFVVVLLYEHFEASLCLRNWELYWKHRDFVINMKKDIFLRKYMYCNLRLGQ